MRVSTADIREVSEHAQQVQRLFDHKASSWSAKYASGGSLSRRLARFRNALRALVPAPAHVLDLGCGTGELARELSSASYDVVGIESAPAMLALARGISGTGSIAWMALNADWRTLPFADQQFDAVVASSVLEYVDEPLVVVAECKRVLRTRGILLCTVPNPRHPIRRVEAAAETLSGGSHSWLGRICPDGVRNYVHYLHLSKNRFAVGEWRELASRAGLDPVPVDGIVNVERGPLAMLAFQRKA
ncbi:MAG TPA: class I SAM-dependent methyltransferase [Vicinamibacterales bacterium]|nr:class I SAM-dependent methyltransferase [Vicinamibacterales bacterium]